MIYTFGDGFATGHIWPCWPQLLSAVCNQPVENHGYPGAGNDFLLSTALDIALQVQDQSTFIIQWAAWKRFDKLLQDDSWNNTIANDKKYAHAVFQVGDKTWWLSSGSDQLNEYHAKYQQQKQKQTFDIYHMILLHNFLHSKGHRCFYCLTYDFDTRSLSKKELELLIELPWVNGLLGMDSLINSQDRGTEIQPAPLGQARWLQSLPFDFIDHNKLSQLIELLSQTSWIPYDPDREELWNQIVKKLS